MDDVPVKLVFVGHDDIVDCFGDKRGRLASFGVRIVTEGVHNL